MIALIRKELRQHAPFLAVAIAWTLVAITGDDVGERFVASGLQAQLLEAMSAPVLAAAMLGCWQITHEERRGTLSYLVHRELGVRRVLGAKAAAGLALVAAVAFVPPLLE